MRIQHNIPAMSSYRNYTNNTAALSKNLEKLSSGYKINRAGDDAAGLAISEKMRAQITGLEVAQKNAKDGISLVQTAEGALTEVHSMLNRMYELAEQSANGTYADEVDREQLQKEVDSLRTEINRIADSSNFNGINLLDGSMSAASTAADIKVEGVDSSASEGVKGSYAQSEAIDNPPQLANVDVGDTFEYNVGLSDGTSFTAKLTLQHDDTGKGRYYLVGNSGTEYTLGTDDQVDAMEDNDTFEGVLLKGLTKELQKSPLSEKYSITDPNADGTFVFTALKEGLDTPAVLSIDYRFTEKGVLKNVDENKQVLGVTVTEPKNAGVEIALDDIVEYDGTNADQAIFTINGKKFALLTNTMDGTTKNDPANNDEYLRAVAALGSDVIILVGGVGGLKPGAADATAPVQGDAANSNWAQNCKAIKDATGLDVTDAYTEANSNSIDPGKGIRLSISADTADNSLQLQIGDTADSFNQLRVSIKDCHAKAIGIGSIDISTQEGATTAMKSIKDAINYISDVRGTLGATQNRLDHTINNLSVMQENIQDAESTIRDVDVAKEMMEYTKNNILVQSAQAMLAQANQLPQGVLQLLQ